MNLKEFVETITEYANEIGCMNNEEGYMGSHKIVATIRFEDTDGNNLIFDQFEIDSLGGCGCGSGITVIVKKVEE